MSAFKSILVHMDASARSIVRLRLAETLASRHDATLSAAYAATPAAMGGVLAWGEGSSVLAAAAAEIDADNLRHARASFDQAGLGWRAEWRELTADVPMRAFTRAALTADLLVLGQYDRSDPGGRIVPSDFAESVVSGSGKPAGGGSGSIYGCRWGSVAKRIGHVKKPLVSLQCCRQIECPPADGMRWLEVRITASVEDRQVIHEWRTRARNTGGVGC